MSAKPRKKQWAQRYEDRLLEAVAAWVKSRGGTAIVVGGIQVQWSDEPGQKFKFMVAVGVVGQRPTKDVASLAAAPIISARVVPRGLHP